MKVIKDIGVMLLLVFSPIKEVVITVLVLCLADLLLGIIASVKRKEPISSRGIRATVLKIGMYETAILLSHLVGLYLVDPSIPVLKIVSGVIGLSELKSVLEHLDDLSGGSAIKSVIMAVQKLVSKKE